MIKVYFDWNVLSQMKNGKHPELADIIIDNEKLLIPYSTSHINDLSSKFIDTPKQRKFINSDLEFISTVTNQYCLFNNGDGIVLDIYPPKDLFNQNIEDNETFRDLSIDGLMKTIGDDHLANSIMKPIFNMLKSIPLGEPFKQAYEDPKSAEMMEKLFPGLKENPTMGGFFESFSKMNFNLNELEGYKDLRNIVQSGTGINRDKIFDTENPFDFIQKTYENLGVSLDMIKQDYKNNPKWFDEISNEYLKLDIHGYQEDKVNIKKGRKETFTNTSDDAFHAAYASTCNFYVINDNKSFKKTKKVFEKLNINTIVFKPFEFLDYYKSFLCYDNPITDIKILLNILKSEHFYESKTDDGVSKVFYFPYFLFGFFNKIVCFDPVTKTDEFYTFLSQDKPTNWFLIINEVEMLIRRLLTYFGNDKNMEGELKPNEFNKEFWTGRIWEFENYSFRLQAVNGFIQLYLDYDYEKEILPENK